MRLLCGGGLGAFVPVLVLVACAGHDAPRGTEADAGVPDATTDEGTGPDGGGPADATAADVADAANPDGADAASQEDAADAADAAVVQTPVVGYTVMGEITYPFARPYSLAVDSSNNLYVSEQTDAPDTHSVYLFTPSYASDIAPGRSRILKFDSAGTYLGWIGGGNDSSKGFHPASLADAGSVTAVYGHDPGVFNMIRGMAFDGADHLYVLDNWRIQELDAAHAFVRWTCRYGSSSYGWRVTGQPAPY